MTKEQIQRLEDMLRPLAPMVAPHAAHLAASAFNGHLPTRIRWDWLNLVQQSIRWPWIEEIYKEGTDAHIDTALRKAVANLGFPQFAESK